jgi:hypothetical protein
MATRWLAVAGLSLLLFGGCGRLGVELIAPSLQGPDDGEVTNEGEPDAQSGLMDLRGDADSLPQPLGDAGSGAGALDGSASADGALDAMSEDAYVEPPPLDAGPPCVPLSSTELSALSRAACFAYTTCPGQSAPPDSDGDRAPNACDPCPNDTDNDSDGDSFCVASDNCPTVANADQVDSDTDGSGDACDTDDDNDGVLDTTDNCRLVRNASQADADSDGRGDACDSDLDGDGVADASDNCPSVANATQTNSDGASDGGDACDTDDDNDGVLDGSDNCPVLANPTQTNSDGTADGGDACDPDDDNDGTPDTSDGCPYNAGKAAPGVCGCAYPENCTGLKSSLVHRYRFDGASSAITDSVGSAHGTATVSTSGSGTLSLSTSAQYATLPSALVSQQTGATIELWLTWRGGAQNQRAISFGTATPNALNVNCNGGSYCTGTSTSYANGSWYRLCTARTCTWDDAANGCRSAGGYLMKIDSAQEQQYIATHPDWSDVSLWLGGNDRATEGQWYWSNASGEQGGGQFWSGGANGSASGGAYTNWDVNEPSSTSGKDCAFLYKSTMKWWAWDCTGWGGHAVCEWRGHQTGTQDRGVWFTPSDGSSRPRLSYKASGSTSTVTGASAFPGNTETHVALVLNPASNSLSLFINGVQVGSVANSDALSGLRDGDNWLGRSQVSGDPALNASFSELRIYNRALSAAELQTSALGGPDPSFL